MTFKCFLSCANLIERLNNIIKSPFYFRLSSKSYKLYMHINIVGIRYSNHTLPHSLYGIPKYIYSSSISVTLRMWLKNDRSYYLYYQRYIFFVEELTHKNSTVKCTYCGAILWWVIPWEDSQAACEQGRNMLERLVMICGASRRSLKVVQGNCLQP